jgi:hypothetical protein
LAEFFASYDLSWAFQKESQDLKGLVLELDLEAGFA